MRTSKTRVATAALGLALTLSGLAAPVAMADPQRPAENRSCFYADRIENYSVVNDRLVYLRVGVGEIYRLDLMNACHELTFRQNIEFTHSGASALICSPINLSIRFHQAGARRFCPVSQMRRLTPAEVAALPKGVRP